MSSQLPHSILFDMDDTLLTDGVNVDPCWRACFERLGDRLAPHPPELVIAAIKERGRIFWSDPERHRSGRARLEETRRALVGEALRALGIGDEGLADTIAATFSQLRDEAIAFCAGARETLVELRARGVYLALITNGASAMQRRKIARFGLAELVDCVLVEGEFGVGKPDLRVYRHALDQLGARPHSTWMVGDNLEWDVAAPQRLGICGIWVDHQGAGLPAGSPARPDRIIRALPDLLGG
jgi:putative hydrolase of the HAD superfamily